MVRKKAERIHANGKTRPVRDKKGHFVGSVSLEKTKERLMKAIDDYSPPKNKPHVKRGICKSELVKTNGKPEVESMADLIMEGIVGKLVNNIPIVLQSTPAGHLTVYRVYNTSAGQGCGYYFIISQNEVLEPVMTLYNPTTDMIALERAIIKYRQNTKSWS